jgi:hypothetical protein
MGIDDTGTMILMSQKKFTNLTVAKIYAAGCSQAYKPFVVKKI